MILRFLLSNEEISTLYKHPLSEYILDKFHQKLDEIYGKFKYSLKRFTVVPDEVKLEQHLFFEYEFPLQLEWDFDRCK